MRTCKICSERQAASYIEIFPFYYEINTVLREHKERRGEINQMETSIKSQ